MILLLGASGYIGTAFQSELYARDIEFMPVSRSSSDYTTSDTLCDLISDTKATFLINAAGYTGKPNVDACELNQSDTYAGNVTLVDSIAKACRWHRLPWGHVSSGCIYSGCVVSEHGLVDDLNSEIVKSAHPADLFGIKEDEPANFTPDRGGSFYSWTKIAAERLLVGQPTYVWRLRIPFDQYDNPRNYLTKMLTYDKVYGSLNSFSHRGDFVSACLDCWDKKIPYGVYNMTNPGVSSTSAVVRMLKHYVCPDKEFTPWESEHAFREATVARRSNCLLDSSKLLRAGVNLRPVGLALQDALQNWSPRQ